MGRPTYSREERAASDRDQRERVLAALAACIADKGYRATTVADIARAARVSKSVVYAHFRDKDDCLLALFSRATDGFLALILEADERARADGLPWRERVRGIARAYLEALAADAAVTWASLVEVQAAGPSALALRRDVINRYVELLGALADHLAAENPDEVRAVDRDLVLAAVGGIHEVLLARVEQGTADRLPEATDVAAGVLIGLIERR